MIEAGLVNGGLAEKVCGFRKKRCAILSKQLHDNGLRLPLLTRPACEKEMIAVLADTIETADDAARGRGRGFLRRSRYCANARRDRGEPKAKPCCVVQSH